MLWSISGSISLRRAIALLASMALAYVLAIRFTPRQLAALVAAVLGPCMLLSLVYAAALPGLGWMPDERRHARGIHPQEHPRLVRLDLDRRQRRGHGGRRRRGLGASAGCFSSRALLCLVASGSMTGLLSTIAALCLAVFYAVLKRLRGLARTLFVLVVLQLLAVVAVSTTELLVPTLEALGKDATLTGRIPLWRLVDREIAEHLLFGVGYQAFWTEANPDAWAIWSKLGWPAPHAHNGYRDILLNFGLFGMTIFLVAIVRAVVQGATLLRRAPTDGWLWLNVIARNVPGDEPDGEPVCSTQNDFLFVLFATALLMFGLRAPEVGRSLQAGGRSPAGTARCRCRLERPDGGGRPIERRSRRCIDRKYWVGGAPSAETAKDLPKG